MRHAPPPQPSLTVTTLRALVMLACLVGIPTMALRGTPYATKIREFLVQKLGGSIAEPDIRASLDEAPPFAPPVRGASDASGPFPLAEAAPAVSPHHQPAYGATASDFPQQGSPVRASAPPFQSSPVQAVSAPPPTVGGRASGLSGNQPGAVLANYDFPASASNPESASTVYPPATSDPASPSHRANVPDTSTIPGPRVAQEIGEAKTLDQFLHIQQRLRDLGANYYLLENWGEQGECYRFHCRVAVGNSANFTKHFEATDNQPLGAMTKVLADVESWRSGVESWEALPVSTPTVGRVPDRVPVQPSSPHGPYVR